MGSADVCSRACGKYLIVYLRGDFNASNVTRFSKGNNGK